jgi:hypothetical protein
MQSHTAKQVALDAIRRLPDTADTEEMMYRLYVLENIRRGQQDAANGDTRSTPSASARNWCKRPLAWTSCPTRVTGCQN